MPDDERLTWGFILEVLDVMERHGYHSSDNGWAEELGLTAPDAIARAS